jgi:hypothetical protein
MLSNLNNRSWISNASSAGDATSKGGFSHRVGGHGGETTGTVVRIQKDVTTDEQSSGIPMDSLAFGRHKADDAESGDRNSSEYVVTSKNTKGSSYVEF